MYPGYVLANAANYRESSLPPWLSKVDDIIVENAMGNGYLDQDRASPSFGWVLGQYGSDTKPFIFADGLARSVFNLTVVIPGASALVIYGGGALFGGELLGSVDRQNWSFIGNFGTVPSDFNGNIYNVAFTSSKPALMVKVATIYSAFIGEGYTIRIAASGG